MNNVAVEKIAGVIELLLESHSRINEAKPQRYWYPLSMATYGTEEILEALDSMCSFRTTMWEKTLRFEEAFSRYQGSGHSVMVNSGSSADLLLSFLLVDPARPLLKPGDGILVPAVTWPTQIWSPMMAGLNVELVDVDPTNLNISLGDLEQRIRPNTRALFLVHLLGNPCDMDRILAIAKRHELLVLEDCCEALGSQWNGTKVGNFGLGAAFSFFFSHHITTMEGGMITTAREELADRLRVLRAHGWVRNVSPGKFDLADSDVDPRYAFVDWGFNVRPTELQAGFGLRQLDKIDYFTQRRERLSMKFFGFVDASRYLSRPIVAPPGKPVWMALPCMVRPEAPFTRADLTCYLEENGVETRPIVAGNVARQPVSRLFPKLARDQYPGADDVHRHGFYIGLSPLMTDATMTRLIDTLDGFLARHR